MAVGNMQSVTGNGYFSQAVSEYARRMKPQAEGQKSAQGKSIDEFSEKEWDRLLEKVDHYIEEYQEDIKRRKDEALEKQREQAEGNALGQGAKQEWFERIVVRNGVPRTMRFMKVGAGEGAAQDVQGENSSRHFQKADAEGISFPEPSERLISDAAILKIIGKRGDAPYSAMADENGMVEYKGTIFQCDYENNRICLGDVSNLKNCLTVSLEKGGCLVVNRDSIDALARAIGMFSPEDINRIMRAIAQDAKLQQMQVEMEEEISGIKMLGSEEEGKDESEKQTV